MVVNRSSPVHNHQYKNRVLMHELNMDMFWPAVSKVVVGILWQEMALPFSHMLLRFIASPSTFNFHFFFHTMS